MGIRGLESFDRVIDKLPRVLDELAPKLKEAGDATALTIIQTTLAGIGDGDEPFAPYSAAYQAQLDAVGGKPQGTVNLRGVFLHAGQQQTKFKSEASRQKSRAGRKAYIGVGFVARGKAAGFNATTAETRPARGAVDPLSEMSVDLITVTATDNKITFAYNPRANDYMIEHQEGTGRAPQRKWFSLNKEQVKAKILAGVQAALQARVMWFNTRQ